MKKIYALIGKLITKANRIAHFFIKQHQLTMFTQVGTGVYIGKNCTFTKNIRLGDHVSIGVGCCFQSVHGEIHIGNHVMFGPEVHIHGGNHKFDTVGKLMHENNHKDPGEDGIITIEDDVWIGSRVTILKGVTIGKGSIVGTGAIVAKDIPPYSIFTGIPSSSRTRQRWDTETIIEHETLLTARGITVQQSKSPRYSQPSIELRKSFES